MENTIQIHEKMDEILDKGQEIIEKGIKLLTQKTLTAFYLKMGEITSDEAIAKFEEIKKGLEEVDQEINKLKEEGEFYDMLASVGIFNVEKEEEI